MHIYIRWSKIGTLTSLKWLKSQLRRRISSGGKSRVPLGGLTSIFCTESSIGGGDIAPDLPPPTLSPELETRECVGDDAADDKGERFLGFGKGRRRISGKGTSAEEREERRKVVAREGLRIRRDACTGMAAATCLRQEFSA